MTADATTADATTAAATTGVLRRQFQLTIDCADPDLLAHFWMAALGYVAQPPPEGHATWWDFWRSIGVPDDENYDGLDSIVDPEGRSPRIWFQQVPERKSVKNRLHLDIHASGGRANPLDVRRERVIAEADRLVRLGASQVRELSGDGVDHFGITMADPEGNEFCIN